MESIQSLVGYSLQSEVGGRLDRVRINRLQAIGEDEDLGQLGEPLQGICPDVRRILRGIITGEVQGASWSSKCAVKAAMALSGRLRVTCRMS